MPVSSPTPVIELVCPAGTFHCISSSIHVYHYVMGKKTSLRSISRPYRDLFIVLVLVLSCDSLLSSDLFFLTASGGSHDGGGQPWVASRSTHGAAARSVLHQTSRWPSSYQVSAQHHTSWNQAAVNRDLPEAWQQEVNPDLPEPRQQEVNRDLPEPREQEVNPDLPEPRQQEVNHDLPEPRQQEVNPDLPEPRQQEVNHDCKPNTDLFEIVCRGHDMIHLKLDPEGLFLTGCPGGVSDKPPTHPQNTDTCPK